MRDVQPRGSRSRRPGPLLVPAALVVAAILAGIAVIPLFANDHEGLSITLQPATLTPTATPSPSPSPSPSPAPSLTPAAAATRCDGLPTRLSELRTSVIEAMEEYDGAWGFALYDVACESLVAYPLEYAQYPASAGKIVIAIAALQAVEEGLISLEDVEGHLELALHLSLDAEIDVINELLEPSQIAGVLQQSGVSGQTVFEQEWRDARMSPADLARVWAALLRGDLLSSPWTDYLLRLASEAVFPEGFDTFPAELGIDGYEYGQKAGYWVSLEEPDVLVGAGFIRPVDRSSSGFALVLMTLTPMDDVFDEQRRSVFPLLRDFVITELGAPVSAP